MSAGWGPALRIAWREAKRAKLRTSLVVALIMLPVLAVTVGATIFTTAEVTGSELTTRVMGSADARVWNQGTMESGGPLRHGDEFSLGLASKPLNTPETADQNLRQLLGNDIRTIPISQQWREGVAKTADTPRPLQVTAVDLNDPLTHGLFALTEGRMPSTLGEVLVNAGAGFAIGDHVEFSDRFPGDRASRAGSFDVVGIVDDPALTTVGSLFGSRETLAEALNLKRAPLDLLIGTGSHGSVTQADVAALGQHWVGVASRAQLQDPPPLTWQQRRAASPNDTATVATALGIVLMALLQIVLLAGPAFAVGARQQTRTLALVVANGGTPQQTRRIILSSALVIGGLSATLGLALGVLTGWVLMPLAQGFSGVRFGPFDVPWLWLPMIGLAGLVSPVIAALVPARLAARHNVVAALAGRRTDSVSTWRTPIPGAIALVIGVAIMAMVGLRRWNGPSMSLTVLVGLICLAIGTIAVVPLVVNGATRWMATLSLPLHFAARDARRHATRTVPAIAAVAATVAGVVALSVGLASTERKREVEWQPATTIGDAIVVWSPDADLEAEPEPKDWAAAEELIAAEFGSVEVQPVLKVGIPDEPGVMSETHIEAPGEGSMVSSWRGYLADGTALVGDRTPPGLVVTGSQRRQIDAALGAGKAVSFSQTPTKSAELSVIRERWKQSGQQLPADDLGTFPAVWIETAANAPAQAIFPKTLARQLGEISTSAMVISGGATPMPSLEAEQATNDKFQKIGFAFSAGRPYQRQDSSDITMLVLLLSATALMLGGTVTTTFLALADARPDLATMTAVGASPGSRRRIAAATALFIGGLGAAVGVAVGLIPGVAFARMNTTWWLDDVNKIGPYVAIPWLLIVVVAIGLPLLAAGLVAAFTRTGSMVVRRSDR